MDGSRLSNNRAWRFAIRLRRDRRGGTAIEYGLILGMIVLAMFASLSSLADVTVGFWNDIAAKVDNAH